MTASMAKAIFLDRDGTLIESVHYLNRPDQVRLLPGVTDALNKLEKMGFLRIIVTNQAAIGKGFLTEDGLMEIQAELDRQLLLEGASINAWYFCPLISQGSSREIVEHPDRKPGPGMLLRASKDHDISLADSWMVGDVVSDTLAGRNAGCGHTVLVQSGLKEGTMSNHPSIDHVVGSLADLPELIEGLRL